MLKVDPIDKEKLVDPLFRRTHRFWVAVALLLAVIGWGIFMYAHQVGEGLGVTGLNRPVFWGVYMVNFIFLIGVSMAGTLISAVLQLTGANWRRPITRIAEALTVFGLMTAGLQILFDMGRPERVLSVIRYGRLQSPLLWDAISLSVYLLASISALYLQLLPDIALLRDNLPRNRPAWQRSLYTVLALGWRGNREQWRRLEKAITVVAVLIIPIGISLHTVTSWIFSTTVQPGWKSTILGPYFVVGAIFSGLGVLIIVMTFFREWLGLERYFQEKQYRNLRLFFIVMCAIWFYFTYTEHLTLVAEQETPEFVVLGGKLWGAFAPTFWGMVGLMVVAFWVLAVPLLVPRVVARLPVFQPRALVAQAGLAAVVAVFLFVPDQLPPSLALENVSGAPAGAWILAVLLVLSLGIGAALWLKRRPLVAMVIAGFCVAVGMWLERWNIIVPTMTRPRLIAFGSYLPSATEVALTAGSLALLILLFLLFFNMFPVVSLWEVAEGRVIEEAEAQVSIPEPPPTERRRRGFHWRPRI